VGYNSDPEWAVNTDVIRLAVVASQICESHEIPRKFELIAVIQGHRR